MSPNISVGMEYHSQLKLFLIFELDQTYSSNIFHL